LVHFAVAFLLPAFGLLGMAGGLGADAKCEQCKPPSRVAQILATNQFLASAHTAPTASDKQPPAPAANARKEWFGYAAANSQWAQP